MSLSSPVSLQILEAIRDRVETITRANGYMFDPDVRIGSHAISATDLDDGPVLCVYDLGSDPQDPESFAHDHLIEMQILVEGFIARDEYNDTASLHQLDAAIKKAVFTTDTTLGGLAMDVLQGGRRVKYPDSGERFLAVQQQIRVLYLDTYGEP